MTYKFPAKEHLFTMTKQDIKALVDKYYSDVIRWTAAEEPNDREQAVKQYHYWKEKLDNYID